MKPLYFLTTVLLSSTFTLSVSANSCPISSSATINDAYNAMVPGTHWVDTKKIAGGGGNKLVGIVFENLNNSKGFANSKSLYTHGAGVFKIDYFTSAKARMECRRQIVIEGKNSDGSFNGWLAIDTCAPDTLHRAAAELDKLDGGLAKLAGKDKQIKGQPSNDNPVRVWVKMNSLKFSRKSDSTYGNHCLMDIKMAAKVGGSAKAYKWRLRDSAPNFTGQLTYFGSNGQRYGY